MRRTALCLLLAFSLSNTGCVTAHAIRALGDKFRDPPAIAAVAPPGQRVVRQSPVYRRHHGAARAGAQLLVIPFALLANAAILPISLVLLALEG